MRYQAKNMLGRGSFNLPRWTAFMSIDRMVSWCPGERSHEENQSDETSHDHPTDEAGTGRGRRGDAGDGDFPAIVARLSSTRFCYLVLGWQSLAGGERLTSVYAHSEASRCVAANVKGERKRPILE